MSNQQADEVDNWVPPKHESGWGPLVAAVGVLLGLVAVGVFVVHPWQATKAHPTTTTETTVLSTTSDDVGSTLPSTTTTLGPLAFSATTAPQLPGAGGYLNPELPPNLEAKAFGIPTGYGEWRATAQLGFNTYRPGPASIDRSCDNKSVRAGLTRIYVLGAAGGPQHGQAVLTVRQFDTATHASDWLYAHGTVGFEACYHRFIDDTLQRSLPGTVLTHEAITTTAATPGGKAAHYSANLEFGGLSCEQHEDDYWTAAGVYTLTASFTTCGPPFSQAAMTNTVLDTVELIEAAAPH